MKKTLVPLLAITLLAAGSPPQDGSADHARMVEALAKIAAEAPFRGPYETAVANAKRRFENLPSNVGMAAYATAYRAMGESELRAGNIWEAVGHFEETFQNMRHIRRSAQLRLSVAAYFWLGVAYLRITEIDKCSRSKEPSACTVPMSSANESGGLNNAIDAIEQLGFAMDLARPGSPMYHAARWLLNVAYMTIGSYPDAVTDSDRLDPARYTRDPDPVARFDDAALRVGLTESSLAGGLALDDFDGDGWLDLFVSSIDPRVSLRLYRNRQGGGFDDISKAAGLEGITGGKNLVHADYDNDGDLDLLVLRGGGWGAHGEHPNSLLRNDGGMHFTDVTFGSGLGTKRYPTQTAAWADYDLDGDLDLFVGNESRGEGEYPAELFRNDGNTRFTEVAAAAGVTNDLKARGVIWADFDGDGYPDLYVANDRGANRMYRNQRDGTFVDVAEELGVTRPDSAYAVWAWDIDNDGDQDLLVNSTNPPPSGVTDIWYVAADLAGAPHTAEVPSLYLNEGTEGFVDAAEAWGIARVTFTMGGNHGDLDNDGFLDFYLGTGFAGYESLIPSFMFRNVGGQRFTDATWAGGFGHIAEGNATAFGDWDNDGDQDVFQQRGGLTPGDDYTDGLYLNPGADQQWISVELRGTNANRFGVGARVSAAFVSEGTRRTVHRVVGTGGSFGAAPHRVHLGLERATRVDRLEVHWPGAESPQVFEGLPIGHRYRVVQGTSEPILLDGAAMTDGK